MATFHDQMTARGFRRTTLGGNLVGYVRDNESRGESLILTNADNIAEYPGTETPVQVDLWDDAAMELLAGFRCDAAGAIGYLDYLATLNR
jgi:hypothetical protein